jgi:Arc/MetJ family transcription regulator
MRTNIEIDDALMAAAMKAGGFKTKKDAVEEGLRLVRRRKVYEGLLALRGKLQWDDSDAGWARARTETEPPAAVQEPRAAYAGTAKAPGFKTVTPNAAEAANASKARARGKSA